MTNIMNQQGQIEDIAAFNENSLQELNWAIESSGGEFSLILAHCNSASLRQRLTQQLQASCTVQIREIILEQCVTTLYTTIQAQLGNEHPEAIIVSGLESVKAIDSMLTSANQVREEFRKNFPFPMVLWVTDEVLQKLIRLAPDLQSWTTTVEFAISTEDWMQCIQQTADEVFAKVLEMGAGRFLDNTALNLGIGSPRRTELELARVELQNRGVTLHPEIESSLEFVLGRDARSMEQSRQHYERSLALLQQAAKQDKGTQERTSPHHPTSPPPHLPTSPSPHSPVPNLLERRACLLYCMGLWWWTYAVLNHTESDCARATAKDYFQECITVFDQANREDLVANFINGLGAVLQRMQCWDELEPVARRAITLHQTYPHPFRLARAYGFQAEVALAKLAWKEAQESAQQALRILDNVASAAENSVSDQTLADLEWEQSSHRGWYLFALARAQIALGEKKEAIATLETAKAQTKPQYDPELYIQILCELRDCYIALGEKKEAIATLETAKAQNKPQYDPKLYIQILCELRDCYFGQSEYLKAFHIKQELRANEQKYGFRAFIGAGRLQPKQQIINPALVLVEQQETVAQEIAATQREQDIKRLIERVARPDHKLTIIYGQSGVGKSSILQAGLIPVLKHKAIGTRDVVPVLQQVYPDWIRELGDRLTEALLQRRTSAQNSSPQHKQAADIKSILNQLQINAEDELLTVLIFDQFEEFFFVYKDPKQRLTFYNFLRECLDVAHVRVILSLREDYLYYLLECNDRLTNLEVINNNILDKNILYYLGNFSIKDAKALIQSFTQTTQLFLEASLIDALVEDLAGDFGEIRPIDLQVVGTQLQTEKIITLAQYQEHGPKEELVGRFLEEVIKDCGTKNEQIAKLVLYLLTDENNTRPLKTRADLDLELEVGSETLDLVLLILVKSGLVFKVPAVPADRYQLVHDYLVLFIRQQQSLRLIAELEKEREQRKLTEAKLLHVTQKQLRDARRRATFTLAGLVGAIGVFAVLAATVGINAYIAALSFSAGEKEELERLTASISVGKQLKHWFGIVTDTKSLAVTQLQEAIYKVKERNRLEGHNASVTSVSFSPNGQMLASTSEDGTVKIWRIDGKEIASLPKHSTGITSVSFSPDSQMLASASKDKTIKIWNIHGEKVAEISTLRGHSAGVTSVSFSPNSQMLASSSDDGTIKVWKIDGTKIQNLTGHSAGVTSVSFSPDSQMLVSAGKDDTVKIWSLDGKNINTINDLFAVKSVSFQPDGKTISVGSKYGSVMFWTINGTLLKNIPLCCKVPSISNDGKTLANSDDSDDTISLHKIDGDTSYYFPHGHSDNVTSLSISPDGKILASASKDNKVKLWDIETKAFKFSDGDKDTVTSISFSPDPQTIATTTDNHTVKLWQRNGSLLKTLLGRSSEVSFSHDGQTIATVGAEDVMNFWNLETGNTKVLEGYTGRITKLAFSPDGQTIAAATSDHRITLWHRDGTLIKTLPGHSDNIDSLTFSPNSKVIASVSRDNIVKLWRSDGIPINTFKGHYTRVNKVRFSPDSKLLASIGDDQVVKLWSSNGTLQAILNGHLNYIFDVTFSPDSKTIASIDMNRSFMGTKVNLWRSDGSLIKPIDTFGIINMMFSPDSSTIALTSRFENVQLWKINGTLLTTVRGREIINILNRSHLVDHSPNDKIIPVINDDNTINIWNFDGTLLTRLKEDEEKVNVVKLSPDGQMIISANGNGIVKLWKRDGTLLKIVKAHELEIETFKKYEGEVESISFSPNSQTFASVSTIKSGYDGKNYIMRFWRRDGTLLRTIEGHSNSASSVSLSPDGKTVAFVKTEDVIKLWGRDGTLLKTLKGHTDWVNKVSFSPDGELIASASNDKTLKLWRRDGSLVTTLRGHIDWVNKVSFSPDGELIASASNDKTIKLWRRDGSLINTLKGHQEGVNSVTFSPDGNMIASASNDKTIKLWRQDGTLIKTLPKQNSAINSLSFSPDGTILVSTTESEVTLWGIKGIFVKDGYLLKTFPIEGAHNASFSPDGKTIAVAAGNNSVILNLSLDDLLVHGCDKARDYLKNNPNVEDSDRTVCDDIK